MKKYIIAPLKQRLSTIPVTQQHVNAWTKDWQFFFIIGVGRSGTVFLSNLLNQAPGAYVFHEPVFEDFIAEVFGHYSSKSSARYIRNFRKKEVYARMRDTAAGVYGEVNGALRCHVDALNVAFPSATFLHLVRDGRDVVRSHMSRRTMTLKNPLSLLLHPTKSDPWYKQWPKMDRLQECVGIGRKRIGVCEQQLENLFRLSGFCLVMIIFMRSYLSLVVFLFAKKLGKFLLQPHVM